MKNVIRKILKEYVTEKRKDWIREHCNNAFSEDYDRNFCYAATRTFKDTYSFQEKMRDFLSRFTEKYKDEINTIKWDTLTSDHDIAKEGLKELEWVKLHGKELCPEIEENIKKILKDFHDGTFVYYADKLTGEYHLLNRLDTNYSALAVMFTEYFRERGVPYSLNYHIHNQKSWDEPVRRLIEWILKPITPYPIPFPNKSEIFKDFEFEEKPLSKSIFKDLINNLETEVSKKTLKVLNDVREAGFSTERMFMKKLEQYGINYQNFGRDYGFVDRKLGIDLFVELKDGWYPVQVKSSEREQTLITKLGCEGALVVYPNEKGKFMVLGVEFERFFCKNQKVCKEYNDKSEVKN